MSSLQRTGVCMLDGGMGADNLYESISRHASLSQKQHPQHASSSMASLSMRRDSSSAGVANGATNGFCMQTTGAGQGHTLTSAAAEAAATPSTGGGRHNSITRYSSRDNDAGDLSLNRSHCQHYTPGSHDSGSAGGDSYAPMSVARPAPQHPEQDVGYLQPSPG